MLKRRLYIRLDEEENLHFLGRGGRFFLLASAFGWLAKHI